MDRMTEPNGWSKGERRLVKGATLGASVGAVLAVLLLGVLDTKKPSSKEYKANATLFENVIVDQSLQLNSATASTLASYDASKKLHSYTGAALKNDDGATICTIGSDGLGNCNVAVAGAGTSGHLTVFQSAPPNNRTIGDYPGATCGSGTFANALNSNGTLTCAAAGSGSLGGSGSGIAFWTGSATIGSYSGSGCGAGSAIGTLSGSGAATCVATGTGTVTSTGSAGFITSFTSQNVIQNWGGSGCGAGSALQALSGSGTPTCVGVVTTATASVSIPAPTPFGGAGGPASVNLTTQGSIDWLECGAFNPGNSAYWSGTSSSQAVTKRSGGWLAATWKALGAGTTTTNSDPGMTFTSTGADTWSGTGYSGGQACGWFGTPTSAYGSYLAVPAGNTSRILRWYLNGTFCDLTVTCTLTLATTSATRTITLTTNHLFTITYNSNLPGDTLVCTATTGNQSGGTCVFNNYAATLGTI
jgi:hypothetical protein